MLSSTVPGGTWPSDITHERVVQEKGVGFEPGGETPDSVRTTAWLHVKTFSPIRHFVKTDSAFRRVLQKEFGSRPCFSYRHVSRTFVMSHRQRTPSRFCTVTAAHSPLFS